MQKKILAAVVASMMAGQAMAATIVDDGTNKVTIGGYLDLRYVDQNNNNPSVDDSGHMGDSSRVNFAFESKLTEATTAFAKTEWSIDTAGTSSGDFLGHRLSYVGIANEQLGSVSYGKQWSSYGTVAGWTDMFATTGGSASGYYGADDADLGTARADDALQYNHSIMGLNISAQTQVGEKAISTTDTRDGSYGIAASYDLPMGLSVGAAYNYAKVNSTAANGDYKAKSAVVGVKFEADKLYAAFTYADLKDRVLFSEIDTTEVPADMASDVRAKDATGYELYVSYQLNDIFKVEGGYNQLKGEDENGADLAQEIKYFPMAVVYTQGPIQLSGTYQFEKSTDVVDGVEKDVDDKIVLQARYYF